MRRDATFTLMTALTVAAACGGGDQPDGTETALDTTAIESEGGNPANQASADTSRVSPERIALGGQIFRGEAAGAICFTCHAPDGTGTLTGPDLTDDQWLNADGTLESIASVVRTGVAEPKEFAAPMPPMGGTSLTEDQIQAVAAYVYSLSHGG